MMASVFALHWYERQTRLKLLPHMQSSVDLAKSALSRGRLLAIVLIGSLLLYSGIAQSAVPDAPTGASATAGNNKAIVTFNPPASDGGLPISSYVVMANPGGNTASAAMSPIVVNGLANGTAYTFTVTATNATGTGPASSASNAVTPTPLPGALTGVLSRKTHDIAGIFNLPIDRNVPILGAVTVEPRAIGSAHTIVFQFENMISAVSAVNVVDEKSQPVGNATHTITGSSQNEVSVLLANVPDRTRAAISLSGVNASDNASASVGFLVGDVNNTRAVTAGDISGLKARVGRMIDGGNFKFDIDADGEIDAADVSAAKARAGKVLPGDPAPTITSASGLPNATQYVAYSRAFTANSDGPVTWTVTNGALPTGLSLNSSTGLLSGTPYISGSFTFTVTATNTWGNSSQTVSLFIIFQPQPFVDESSIPMPSKVPYVIPPFRPGQLNGAGSELNAYSIDPARCAGKTSPPLVRSWQHNINFAQYAGESPIDYVTMDAGEAFSFKFVAPATGYRFITFNPATYARFVATFISLSSTACDFNEAPAPSKRACYAPGNGGNNNITYQMVGTGSPDTNACQLTPGAVYYLNIRFWTQLNGSSVDACAADPVANGISCGGILQIR